MVTSIEQIRSVQYLASSQVERPVINFLVLGAQTETCRPMPKKATDVEPSPFMIVDAADFGLRANVGNFVANWKAACADLRGTGLSPQHIVDILNRSMLRAAVSVARVPESGIPLFAVQFRLRQNNDLHVVVNVTAPLVVGAFGTPARKPAKKSAPKKPEAKKPEAKKSPAKSGKPAPKPAPAPKEAPAQTAPVQKDGK